MVDANIINANTSRISKRKGINNNHVYITIQYTHNDNCVDACGHVNTGHKSGEVVAGWAHGIWEVQSIA